ncbi:DUF547 domain-containing protein [Flavobacteriaceae bacterium KMM 6898]|nr:DUF547 domain-containing protein [Flavobacteriaceae bacterium KMM 6898]
MKVLGILLLIFLFFLPFEHAADNSNPLQKVDYNELSEQFLRNIKEGKDTKGLQDILAKTSLAELEAQLKTNNQKTAFWLNIYNAYIQVILADQPELYKDRSSFFKKDQINIAGRIFSFAEIEHGMVRKSQWEYGLGYIRKWFPNKFERTLRVEERDYRVHFALNCGAKDCPPVAIYDADRLDEQLEKGTQRFLTKTSEFDSDKREAAVTSLFSWFRGDFGGKSGTKDILKKYGIIKSTKDVDLVYKNYDWTLYLDNFIEL